MWLQLALALSAVALLVAVVVLHATLQNALRFNRSSRSVDVARRLPLVSVIRPIRGLDERADENLQAALVNDYPGPLETLFVFDDPAEPAVPLARAAIERNPTARARILFCGPPPPNMTGKLNAMIAGMHAARGAIVAFVDSDTRPGPRTIARLVSTLLSKPDAGAAFAPVVVSPRPRTVGDVGYALLLNGLYGPAFAHAAARSRGTLPFIMGQVMVLRREAIAAIGGLESAAGQLVDDMYLGARLNAAGHVNLVVPGHVPIIQAGMSLSEFVRVFVRWIAFSRTGLPGRSFKLVPWFVAAGFWLGLALAVAAATAAAPLAMVLGLLAALLTCAATTTLHRAAGGAPLGPRAPLVALALFLLGPLVYLRLVLWPRVSWRGRRYRLDLSSRLGT